MSFYAKTKDLPASQSVVHAYVPAMTNSPGNYVNRVCEKNTIRREDNLIKGDPEADDTLCKKCERWVAAEIQKKIQK